MCDLTDHQKSAFCNQKLGCGCNVNHQCPRQIDLCVVTSLFMLLISPFRSHVPRKTPRSHHFCRGSSGHGRALPRTPRTKEAIAHCGDLQEVTLFNVNSSIKSSNSLIKPPAILALENPMKIPLFTRKPSTKLATRMIIDYPRLNALDQILRRSTPLPERGVEQGGHTLPGHGRGTSRRLTFQLS